MVTTFNKKDLVSFGKYLLSDERAELIKNNPQGELVEEKLREVHHSDIENWMESSGFNEKPNRKVKVGDIVNYYPSKDQLYDKHARNNNSNIVPAMVTAVWGEDCCNLTVFPDVPCELEPHFVPAGISVTSCAKLPEGTHNDQTGMWDFR